MTFNELKRLITKMTPLQRRTEVCVFEEGTRKYIWPARIVGDPRPYLEGVAAEGDPEVTFFGKPKGTKDKDVDSVQPHVNELDAPLQRPDRVRAPKPTGLDRTVKRRKRK